MNPQNKLEMLYYRIQLIWWCLLGECYKLFINFNLITPNSYPKKGNVEKPDLVVSLTTYGRRVYKVHYTIISLLRQTYQPDMVILWLDDENWNDENLPKSLLRLKKKGLTVKYCKDLKSYKKLIPALLDYPNSTIVTCDDDIYYKKDMLQRLMDVHKQWPNKVIAHRAHRITFDDFGKLRNYSEWLQEISGCSGKSVFPTSGGGTLYRREFFHHDVCNEHIFMELAPKADDVWNYFMGLLNNTDNVVLAHNGYIYIPLDVFFQFFHKNSNLSSSNYNNNYNDVQIGNIMQHYNLTSKNLYE